MGRVRCCEGVLLRESGVEILYTYVAETFLLLVTDVCMVCAAHNTRKRFQFAGIAVKKQQPSLLP